MPDLTIVETAPSTALERLADDYLAHCRARGLSVATVRNSYGRTLATVFLPWCAEQGIAEPGQLTTKLLDRFTTHLLDDGGRRGPLSRASVHSYTRAVNHFLKWAEGEGVAAKTRAQLPSLPKKVLDVLSREEIKAMEDAVPAERDKLIIRVLGDTGIRLGELLGLRVGDLREERGERQLLVSGKGDKERLVPVPPAVFGRLRRYAQRGRREVATDRIFVSLRRSPGGEYAPLTPSGIQQMIRNAALTAGVEKKVHPHLFRHSYATNCLRKGMNVIELQGILGHADLSMIASVYQHLNASDRYKAAMRVLLDD